MSDRLTLEEWLLSEEAEALREERYVSGQEVGRIVGWLDGQRAMRERAAALVGALYDQCPGQHDYLQGWQHALDLAEQRIRALEV